MYEQAGARFLPWPPAPIPRLRSVMRRFALYRFPCEITLLKILLGVGILAGCTVAKPGTISADGGAAATDRVDDGVYVDVRVTGVIAADTASPCGPALVLRTRESLPDRSGTRAAVRDTVSLQLVAVSEADRAVLARAVGLTVAVIGIYQPMWCRPRYLVSTFTAIGRGATPVFDGILEMATASPAYGDSTRAQLGALRRPDGTRVRLTTIPPALAAHAGARVWVSVDHQAGVAAYGILAPRL